MLKERPAPFRAPKGGIGQYKGGQFIPIALVDYEKRVATEAFGALQDEFAKDIQFLRAVAQLVSNVKNTDVEVPPPLSKKTVEDRAVRAIRSYYSRAFLLGKRSAGNLLSISETERSVLRKVRTDEYKFLRKFLQDIDDKVGKIPYEKRAAFYANALREAYWLGFCLGDTSKTRRIYWYFGNTIEHCTDCAYFAKQAGGWSMEDFYEQAIKPGKMPQSGSLECKGFYCQCYLTDKPVAGGMTDGKN